MSILRHTTLAMRRIACRTTKVPAHVRPKQLKRLYSALHEQPVLQISQEEAMQHTQSREGWVLACLALIGLSFSTYSTHQLMAASAVKTKMIKKN